jgi:DNA-binding PadR family transcriptional regulator
VAEGYSELEFHILCYLADKPRHGWPIKNWLHAQRGVEVPFASVYRALERLRQLGLLTVTFGEPTDKLAGSQRKYFSLNASGRDVLRKLIELMVQRAKALESSAHLGRDALGRQDPPDHPTGTVE